jgi:iron-sulfur cluster repair protein YtfE (RIC family)
MPTARQEAESSTKRREARRATNALTLLRKDHKMVSDLFDDFEKKSSRGDTAKMKEIAEQVCAELTVHAQIEEEIFYPALREAFPEHEDVLDEAEVEHASAKELIAKIQGGADSELFEAQVCVLGEYVRHHVKEEHALFTKIQKSRKCDFQELGARLAERKAELQQG